MGLGSEIRDPEKTYFGSWIPDPGVKKAPDPGSGSATLVQSTYFLRNIKRRGSWVIPVYLWVTTIPLCFLRD
jgi:hypothetical protein